MNILKVVFLKQKVGQTKLNLFCVFNVQNLAIWYISIIVTVNTFQLTVYSLHQ